MIKRKYTDEQLSLVRNTLIHVHMALDEKGYNATNQIQGYLLSEDPTFITTYKEARAMITSVDRDVLLGCILEIALSQ